MELPLPSASLYLEITIYINIYIYIFIYIVKFVYSILFKGWGAIFIVIIVTIVTTVTAGGWSSKMRLFVLIVKKLSEETSAEYTHTHLACLFLLFRRE